MINREIIDACIVRNIVLLDLNQNGAIISNHICKTISSLVKNCHTIYYPSNLIINFHSEDCAKYNFNLIPTEDLINDVIEYCRIKNFGNFMNKYRSLIVCVGDTVCFGVTNYENTDTIGQQFLFE